MSDDLNRRIWATGPLAKYAEAAFDAVDALADTLEARDEGGDDE